MKATAYAYRMRNKAVGYLVTRILFSPIQIFCAPSFDDKILEVVAVFGSMQMAVSRVIKLQHHRIAQVRKHNSRTLNTHTHVQIQTLTDRHTHATPPVGRPSGTREHARLEDTSAPKPALSVSCCFPSVAR